MASGTLKTPGWILRSLPPPQFSSFSSHIQKTSAFINAPTRLLGGPCALCGANPPRPLQFFMRWHDCMVHGKAMSSLKLGTLGARHPSQSPQLAAKESTMDVDALKMRSKSALQASGVSRYNATLFWSVLASICVSEAEALTYERGGHFLHSTNVFLRARSRHTCHWKHVLPSSQCAYGTLTVTKSRALSQL